MPRTSTKPTFDVDGGLKVRLIWSGTQPIAEVLSGTKRQDYMKIKQDMSKDQIASALKNSPGVVVPDGFMAALVAGPAAGAWLQASHL